MPTIRRNQTKCSTKGCKSIAVFGEPHPLCEICMEKTLNQVFLEDLADTEVSFEDIAPSGIRKTGL